MINVSFADWNYRHGMGCILENDYESAAGFLQKAAEGGHPDAQFNLGYMYAKGFGVPRDNGNALKWLGKAAAQGHSEAKVELGMLEGEKESFREEVKPEGPAAQDLAVPDPEVRDSGEQDTVDDDLLVELYEEGLKEKDSGNISRAVVIWKGILEKDFRNLNAINAIACVYAQTGRLDMAKKYIDMAMKVGGDKADYVRANLAGIFYYSARFKEAEEILSTIECKDARTTGNLTRLLCTQGKMEKARDLIEEFLSREGSSEAPDAATDRSLQEIIMRGVDCMLECSPYDAVDFLENHAHMLPPGQKSVVYFNAGIHFLQEEDDGITALNCLSEAVRNDPDDEEMKEAESDAALKVIEELDGKEKIFNYEKLALALAREKIKPAFRIVTGGSVPTMKKGRPGKKKNS